MSFSGASVLVTGGSRGIGKAIALRFATLGAARVAIGYLRSTPRRPRHRGGARSARRRAGARPRQRLLRARAGGGRRARAARRARPQRRDRRDPPRPRDRGQALGLDARRERPRAPRARARPRRRGCLPAARSSASRASAPSACSRTTRSSAPRRPRSSRSSATSPSSSRRAGSASTPSPAGVVETGALDHFPNREAMLELGARNPAGRLVAARGHRGGGDIPLLARGRDGARPDARRRRRLLAAGLDGADRPQPARLRRRASLVRERAGDAGPAGDDPRAPRRGRRQPRPPSLLRRRGERRSSWPSSART